MTRDELHLTRGRANTLRLALSGQLGPDALASRDIQESLSLCVGCKACRTECPTGVDMARMKIEVQHQRVRTQGLRLRDRIIGNLPRLAPFAAPLRHLLNLRDVIPGMAQMSERLTGLAAARPLPRWQKPYRDVGRPAVPDDMTGDGRDVILFADTFNRYFEPENLAAAERVLRHLGYRLHVAPRGDLARPLCCGRSFLAVGLVELARAEARRNAEALLPLIARGARVVGLEPSCILTFRDEYAAMLPADQATPLAASVLLFEELLDVDLARGHLADGLDLADQKGRVAHLHGHCHQKALGAMGAVERLLRRVPGLDLRVIQSSCCGMAGAFGHQAETYDISMKMAELSLLPAVRSVGSQEWIIADGTSCRSQIRDGGARSALHVAAFLDRILSDP